MKIAHVEQQQVSKMQSDCSFNEASFEREPSGFSSSSNDVEPLDQLLRSKNHWQERDDDIALQREKATYVNVSNDNDTWTCASSVAKVACTAYEAKGTSNQSNKTV